jgi:hypothetical protein
MIERGTGLLVIVNAAGARQGEGMEDNALTALSPVTAGFSTLVHVTWRRSFRVSLDADPHSEDVALSPPGFLQRWRRSPLTMKSFCRDPGFSYCRFWVLKQSSRDR